MLPKDVSVQTLLQYRDVLQGPLLSAPFAVQLKWQRLRQYDRREEVEVKIDSDRDEDGKNKWLPKQTKSHFGFKKNFSL